MKKITLTIQLLCLLTVVFAHDKKPRKNNALKSTNYEIFGENHSKTLLVSDQLYSHVYYIVSGHGGPDPGANTVVDGKFIAEDEYAYDVSLRLAKNLIMHGAKVYMIVRDENDGIRDEEFLKADTDEVVYGGEAIPLNQAARLKQRTNIINKLYHENKSKGFEYQRVIETHVDSRYTENKVDVFFYYNESKSESKVLAHSMFSTMKEKYELKQKGRGYTGEVKARGLWTIKESIPPVVFIELGNITNEFDRKRLLIPDNRQAIANWFLAGILKH